MTHKGSGGHVIPFPEPEGEAVTAPARDEPRDPRVDKFISWVLTTGLVVVLGWLASSFQSLAGEVHATRDEVSRIATRVAILEKDDATKRLRDLEQGATERNGRLVELERRLVVLERGK